jgi:hypothetical protein
MSRIKDISAETLVPAPDDYGVIDGNSSGPRKIRVGSAMTRDVPTSGNAGAAQVVLGNDTRLVNNLPNLVISTPQDGDLIQYDSPTSTWRNSQKSLLTDGGNY